MSGFSNTLGVIAGNDIRSAGGGSVASFGGLTPNSGNHMGEELFSTFNSLQNLRTKTEQISHNMQRLQEDNTSLHELIAEFTQKKALFTQEMAVQSEMQIQERYQLLLTRKNSLEVDLDALAKEYDVVQNLVINELRSWQRNQALAGNGATFRDNLDDIQNCIEFLVDVVGKILANVTVLIHQNIGDNVRLSDLLRRVRDSQVLLVLSSFIVEKQPPQVMKTNTKLAAAVRWLIGPQLNIYMNNPTVECIILSESQAQRHSQRTAADTSNGSPQSSGEILNNVTTMEYQQQTRHFSASFRNMQLKKIKRAEKKGTESVMDEKFALLFYTSSIVNDYRIRVWTLSLPVVVIVHGNQEPQSWATITWDNAFSEMIRDPFTVPDKVCWSQLEYTLNAKFSSATGRPLTEDNLNFLYEKLFRNDNLGGDHKDYITWAQFCKEPLPDRNFTFWDWFYAIIKLTKDHLLGLWQAGLVVGFINKRKTDEVLRLNPVGTFLLRFSDSELGGISVAFVNDQNVVVMVAPWTARDLTVRGLADRIQDLSFLHYIYPTNKTKEEAFREFLSQRTEEQTTRDGYVANTIRTHVPSIEGSSSMINTPHHLMQTPNSQDVPMARFEEQEIDNDRDMTNLKSIFQRIDQTQMRDLLSHQEMSSCGNFNISDFDNLLYE